MPPDSAAAAIAHALSALQRVRRLDALVCRAEDHYGPLVFTPRQARVEAAKEAAWLAYLDAKRQVEAAKTACGGFHDAFIDAEAKTKEARRLSDVEFRFTTRFSLWLLPPQERYRAQVDRLMARRRAAIEAAEDADWRLSRIWDRSSRDMPPLQRTARL